MGDKIIFPADGNIYLEKGVQAFEQGRKKEAVHYLKQAAKLMDKLEMNHYIAFMLANYSEYEEALAIMNKEKYFYINNESHATFYTGILIKDNQFLEAEYIIQKYQLAPQTVYNEEWDQLKKELEDRRLAYNLDKKLKDNYLIQSLELLADYPPASQLEKVEEANSLDLSNLQKLAPTILTNNQLSENTRRSYLEILIKRKDPDTYSFLWFDKTRSVCPKNLPIFADIKLVTQLLEKLDEKLNKYPTLHHWIEAEIFSDLLLLYPYVDEVITDPDFWVGQYIMDLDLFNEINKKQLARTEEEIQMKKMVDQLHIISEREEKLTKK